MLYLLTEILDGDVALISVNILPVDIRDTFPISHHITADHYLTLGWSLPV